MFFHEKTFPYGSLLKDTWPKEGGKAVLTPTLLEEWNGMRLLSLHYTMVACE